jgi:hypothetical protein
MSYFAEITDTNEVRQIISINNDVLMEPDLVFPQTEVVGQAFIANTLGLKGEWRQTSFNASFRYHYAGIGYTFDPNMGEHGAFIPPQPYLSWTLDENAQWQPPIPYPNDENLYIWNETDNSWDIVENK